MDFKKINITKDQKISDQLNNFLIGKYTAPIFDVLKVNDQDIKDFGIDESIIDNYLDFDVARLINITQKHIQFISNENIRNVSEDLFASTKGAGLTIGEDLITRALVSALTKRFLILTGLSGSGKTKLAEAVAYWLSAEPEHQVCMVAVGADWTNNEPLLGYADAINKGHYCAPASGIFSC